MNKRDPIIPLPPPIQVNVHCSRNRLNAVTKLSRMNAGQKNSSLTPKMSAKAASCDDTQDACVCDVALILKFQCRKNKYISAGKSWS